MTTPAPARPSATVLLVRQRDELEVLMVERHEKTYFSSALVFPGGLVGEEDFTPAWDQMADGGAGLGPAERALRIAAFRELYEETGLLLGGRSAKGADKAASDDFAARLKANGLRLDLDGLHRFAHWITPEMSPRRYDTHFFLCGLTSDIEPVSDGRETVFVDWMSPARALALARAGERKVLFPTMLNLELLAQSATVDAAIDAARSRRIVTVTPTVERRPEGIFLSVHPDAGYGARSEPAPRGPIAPP